MSMELAQPQTASHAASEAPEPCVASDDPMKAMTLELDARIVASGGKSIFSQRRNVGLWVARRDKGEPDHDAMMRPGRARYERKSQQRRPPTRQRIMGYVEGVLGDGGLLSDFDERW